MSAEKAKPEKSHSGGESEGSDSASAKSSETQHDAEGSDPGGGEAGSGRAGKTRHVFISFFQGAKELFGGVRSPDWSTRLGSFLFLGFFIATLFTVGVGLRFVAQQREMRKSEAAKNDPELQKARDLQAKKAQDEARKKNTFVLGNFNASLKTPLAPGGQGGNRPLNSVELEIVIECDALATRHYIEENIIPAQHQAASALNELTEADLMTAEGKRKLRRTIMYKLNTWLPKGRVEDIFFSHVVVL